MNSTDGGPVGAGDDSDDDKVTLRVPHPTRVQQQTITHSTL